MRRVLFTMALLAVAVPALAQTNPCESAPSPSVVMNPQRMHLTLPEFGVQEADGSFRNGEYLYAAFAQGADPDTATPVQGPSTVPRSAFSLVAGTGDCYLADMPALVPTSATLVLSMRSRRPASATLPEAISPWSETSDSFSFAPSVLVAPGAPRLSRSPGP